MTIPVRHWKNDKTFFAKFLKLEALLANSKGNPEKKIEFEKGAVFEDINNTYFVKLHSMYSAHAILYINQNYAIETTKLCIMAICMNKPHDIYLQTIYKKYNVLGIRSPWFYQDVKYNGQEKYTRITV